MWNWWKSLKPLDHQLSWKHVLIEFEHANKITRKTHCHTHKHTACYLFDRPKMSAEQKKTTCTTILLSMHAISNFYLSQMRLLHLRSSCEWAMVASTATQVHSIKRETEIERDKKMIGTCSNKVKLKEQYKVLISVVLFRKLMRYRAFDAPSCHVKHNNRSARWRETP